MKMNAATDKMVDSFYNGIAASYDDMTGFAGRISREREIIRSWVSKYKFQKVLDAACGSGLHAIILNQMGVSVTGADISEKMLRIARENATLMNANPVLLKSSFLELDKKISEKFDTVLILGNSLVHILDRAELSAVMNVLKKMLLAGGKIVFQILNYAKVLKNRERIVSINRHRETEFIRFYDFLDPYLRFNILQIDWKDGHPVHKLNATKIYPWQNDELEELISDAGFQTVDCYGSMGMEEYDEIKSGNLVLVIKKSP